MNYSVLNSIPRGNTLMLCFMHVSPIGAEIGRSSSICYLDVRRAVRLLWSDTQQTDDLRKAFGLAAFSFSVSFWPSYVCLCSVSQYQRQCLGRRNVFRWIWIWVSFAIYKSAHTYLRSLSTAFRGRRNQGASDSNLQQITSHTLIESVVTSRLLPENYCI